MSETTADDLELVPFDASQHNIEELNDLLHRAYKPLYDAGMHFAAATQDTETLSHKLEGRECWVLLDDIDGVAKIVGTITISPPNLTGFGFGYDCGRYERPGVSVFNRLSVDPEYQHHGLGACLVQHAEERARAMGAHELCLDTAQTAVGLIDWYIGLGYVPVDEAKWDFANYVSIILSKDLDQA